LSINKSIPLGTADEGLENLSFRKFPILSLGMTSSQLFLLLLEMVMLAVCGFFFLLAAPWIGGTGTPFSFSGGGPRLLFFLTELI